MKVSWKRTLRTTSSERFLAQPALLGSLDEDFLPDVDLDHGNLNYTVVIGEVLGNFEAQKNAE